MTKRLELALEHHALGFTVVPVRDDGSKAPAVPWRQAQDSGVTREQLQAWFTHHPTDGIGVLCGAASGGLVMVEIEGREMAANLDVLSQIDDLMELAGIAALWQRVQDGWTEMSPSGGVHWFFTVEDGPAGRNEVLARDEYGRVKSETRADGGMAIIAPSGDSGAPVHPTGRPWLLASGGPSSVHRITRAQANLLLDIFRAFDEQPHEESTGVFGGQTEGGVLRPGDDFNRRASWHEILEPHEWRVESHGRYTGWTRPGKSEGTSATTGLTAADMFYGFSTNAGLPALRPLSKFAVYAFLEHAGDFPNAARDLAARGYGESADMSVDPGERIPWRQLEERNLPGFPMAALGRLELYVAAIARATETAPDMAATAVLGAVSAVIGGRVIVDAPTQGNWLEVLILWMLIIAGPGEGKSPVLGPIRRALHAIEVRRAKAVGDAVRERKRLRETLEASIKHWRGKLVRAEEAVERAEAAEMLRRAYEELDKNPPIHEPRILVADITPESLGTQLNQQKALTMLSTEGGFFGTVAGRYSGNVGNFDVFLQAWSADPFTIDRQSHGDSNIDVERPILTVILTVQPTVVLEVGARSDAVGRGLPARFLYSIPASIVGRRQLRRDVRLGAGVEQLLDAVLNDIDERFERFENTKHRDAPEVVLTVDPAAADLWHERRHEIERMSHPDEGATPAQVGWLAKQAGTTLRLAGAVHYLSETDSEHSNVISAREMRLAVDLSRYFTAHAAAALDDMTRGASTGLAQAQVLRAWIVKHPEFSEREIHQALKGQSLLKTKADVEDGLAYLADRGHIDRMPTIPGVHRGRPKSQRWRLRAPHTALNPTRARRAP